MTAESQRGKSSSYDVPDAGSVLRARSCLLTSHSIAGGRVLLSISQVKTLRSREVKFGTEICILVYLKQSPRSFPFMPLTLTLA